MLSQMEEKFECEDNHIFKNRNKTYEEKKKIAWKGNPLK